MSETNVDPVKSFSVALDKIKSHIGTLNAHKTSAVKLAEVLEKYAVDIKVSVVTMGTESAACMEVLHDLEVAAEQMKQYKGLAPDKALDHLKAVATVIHLAEQAGVSLLPEDVAEATAPVVSKWEQWYKIAAESYYAECVYCGSGYDTTVKGWWDDSGTKPFCSLSCVGGKHGGSYIPSGPTHHYRPEFKDIVWFNGNQPHEEAKHNHPKSTPACSNSRLRQRAEFTGQEHWRQVAEGLGVFQPARVLNMSEMKACLNCRMNFNVYQAGWSLDGSSRSFCCNKCATQWCDENDLDQYEYRLTLPDVAANAGVNPTDWESPYVGDTAHRSWMDFLLSQTDADVFDSTCLAEGNVAP
jgi:hypothetical protein